jgi:hypothetical protein
MLLKCLNLHLLDFNLSFLLNDLTYKTLPSANMFVTVFMPSI